MRHGSPVMALAAFDARRLPRHPAALLLVLTPVQVAMAIDPGDFGVYKLLVGAALLPLATACLLASWAATSRGRRDGSEELFASMPVTPADRVRANLVTVAAPAGAAALVLGLALVTLTPWRGLPTPDLPPQSAVQRVSTVAPGWLGLAGGPALVVAAGAVGVAVGRRRVSTPVVVMAATVGLYCSMIAVQWWTWGWQRFLLPAAHDLTTSGFVEVDGRARLVVSGHVPAVLGWHLVYLTGIAVTAVALALVSSRRRVVLAVLTGGAVLLVAGAAGQALSWSASL